MVMVIQSDVAGVSEWNDELSPLRQIGKRSADVGTGFQKRELFFYTLARPFDRLRILGHQESATAL
jgi:hypothetical protein